MSPLLGWKEPKRASAKVARICPEHNFKLSKCLLWAAHFEQCIAGMEKEVRHFPNQKGTAFVISFCTYVADSLKKVIDNGPPRNSTLEGMWSEVDTKNFIVTSLSRGNDGIGTRNFDNGISRMSTINVPKVSEIVGILQKHGPGHLKTHFVTSGR